MKVGRSLCKVLKDNKIIGLIKYVDKLSSDVAINATPKSEIVQEVISAAKRLQETLEQRIGKSAYSSFFQTLETTLSAEKLLCRLQADFNTSAGFELFSSGFKINLDFSLLEKGFAILPSKKTVTYGNNKFDFFSVLVFSCDATSRPSKLAYYSASVVGPGAESIKNNSSEVHLKFESAPDNSCSNSTFSNAHSPCVIDDYLSYASAEKDVTNKLENKTTFLTDMDSDLRSKLIKMIIYENACFKRTKETCLKR